MDSTVQINSIMHNSIVYPVQLLVYDLDGLPGINVPGAVTVESVRQGINNAVQSMDVYAPADNIGAQVAVSGLQAYLQDNKQAKRTSTQQKDLNLVYQSPVTMIKGGEDVEYIIAVTQFTIPDHRSFRIEFFEKEGGGS